MFFFNHCCSCCERVDCKPVERRCNCNCNNRQNHDRCERPQRCDRCEHRCDCCNRRRNMQNDNGCGYYDEY